MATAKYKYVKMVAPGGAVLNFIGIAGTTPEVVLSTDLIKKCIKLGVAVFEIKETEEEILGTKQIKKEFIPLTLKKEAELSEAEKKIGFKEFDGENGGKAVDEAKVKPIPDLEEQIAKKMKDANDEFVRQCIAKFEKEIKAKNEAELDQDKDLTEAEIVEKKAKAHFKAYFEDLKAKETAAANHVEPKTSFDKGTRYRRISDLVKFKEETATTPSSESSTHSAGSESSSTHTATQPASGASQNSAHSGIGESQGGHSTSSQTGPQAAHGNQDTL